MTYQVFFNLDDAPFRLTPDPEYYFPSKQHKEALDTLLYCVETGEGFAQITGDPGVGKTLLIRSFLNQLGDTVNTALILHPRLEAEELFKVILEDLGLAPANIHEMSKESLLRSFRNTLLESANKGFQTIIIIDEAQEIPEKTLEELRLLSNLETDKKKLLQIILVGQRELEKKLSLPGFKQLYQRINIRYRLNPLTLDETMSYIHHRLKIAGSGNISRFTPDIIKQIHKISNGIPRIINTLCERSLMAAFVDGKSSVNQKHLQNGVLSTEYNSYEKGNRDKKNRKVLYVLLIAMMSLSALYFSNPSFRKIINQQTRYLLTMLQKKDTASSTVLPSQIVEKSPLLIQQKEKTTKTDSSEGVSEGYNNPTDTDISLNNIPPANFPTVNPAPAKTDFSSIEIPTASEEPISRSEKEPLIENLEGNFLEFNEQLHKYPRTEKYEFPGTTPITPQDIVKNPIHNESDAPMNSISTQKSHDFKNPVPLPLEFQSISIQQQTGKARLYPNEQPAHIKELTLPDGKILQKGIYLLGRANGKAFLFNHRSFSTWQNDASLADWLWFNFGDSSIPITPVVVSSNNDIMRIEGTEQKLIKSTVKNWASAFIRQDTKELMYYYDDSLLTYRLSDKRPIITSHAEITAKKNEYFDKTSSISLQISEPTCIINSDDTSRALAFFHQQFISPAYRDNGIKVLYLRKTDPSTASKSKWVITGKLWLPEEAKKENP